MQVVFYTFRWRQAFSFSFHGKLERQKLNGWSFLTAVSPRLSISLGFLHFLALLLFGMHYMCGFGDSRTRPFPRAFLSKSPGNEVVAGCRTRACVRGTRDVPLRRAQSVFRSQLLLFWTDCPYGKVCHTVSVLYILPNLGLKTKVIKT